MIVDAPTTPHRSTKRVVRYNELKPCLDAFIDTRTPGSDKKENFTIIGPGVSENPNQHIHITESHGFNIGGARQPPGCTNSQHSHETVEVFFVHSGEWAFRLGEKGEDAEIILRPGDLISIPTHVFRGFENVGDDVGFLWAVLWGDDPGRVLWAPDVFDMAKAYGLVLLENGNLVDVEAGETLPVDIAPIPKTTQDQVNALQRFGNEELAACCVMNSDSDQVSLIGQNGIITHDHGFSIDRLRLDSDDIMKPESHDLPDVLFLHSGSLTVHMGEDKVTLHSGDTLTIARGTVRSWHTDSHADFLRVMGQ